MAGTREYEDLNKNLEIVDGHAVKAPEDYQDPEELYQAESYTHKRETEKELDRVGGRWEEKKNEREKQQRSHHRGKENYMKQEERQQRCG